MISTAASIPESAGEDLAEVACAVCGTKFRYERRSALGLVRRARTTCDDCCAAAVEREIEEERRLRRQRAFELVCPPLYRDTDPSRIDAQCAAAALAWPVDNARGLGLLGATGAGKTRALFLALRRACESGKSIRSISHNAFSVLVQTAFAGERADRGEAWAAMDWLKKCDVLLFDDLGKPPPSERADAELVELVEVRTSHLRPILWSANGSSAWLTARLGADRGEALVRRLTEFSEIVVV